jgi:cholesterol oxidase
MSEFPGLETFRLDSEHGIPIKLHRKRGMGSGGMPVLLVHGASARHETFTIPPSAAEGSAGTARRSLVDWLAREGFEPWLLDWRGSGLVVDELGPKGLRDLRESFDFDQAAQHDVAAALRTIFRRRGSPIGAVGHCMGGGILAQAIATGSVTPKEHGLTRVVLLTLGLFYEPPLDSRLKLQDHILERLLDARLDVQAIDPRPEAHGTWPDPLERLYASWPAALRPHRRGAGSDVHEMCRRLAFMYGAPYLERNLVPEVHGEAGRSGAQLPRQFGPIPLRMYVHGARNSRRGWAASYNAQNELDVFDPQAAGSGSTSGAASTERTPSARECFDRLEQVTLITGDKNQLWHRDSIDRMYEWLTRGIQHPGPRIRKVIVHGYGHQDLLWGRDACRDVFPDIREGLLPRYPQPHEPPARRAPPLQPERRREAFDEPR